MKVFRKITIRSFALSFLLAASVLLGGCSFVGGVFDVVTWVPRKVWGATGGKLLGVKNEQQTDMGPRRKPVGNPQGLGLPVPQTIADREDDTLQNGGYPPMPAAQGGGYPSVSPYGNPQMPPMPTMPQMPPMPQSYQQQGQMPMGELQMPEIMDGSEMDMGADAAYASGGGGGDNKKSGWRIPFLSGKHAMERRYEPLAAEFMVAVGTADENGDIAVPEATWGENAPQNSDNKKKSTRAASMFPLEKYAPKPTAPVQKIEDNGEYPKLGRVPENPQNVTPDDAAAAELDKMMQAAEEAEAKKEQYRKQPPENNNGGEDKPNMKVNSIAPPAPVAKNDANSMENMIDEQLHLVKRREEAPVRNIATSEPVAVAPAATASDARLIRDIATNNQYVRVLPAKTPQPEKGFFASLKDKIFKPAPKTVWRKSMPPQIAENHAPTTVTQQNYDTSAE